MVLTIYKMDASPPVRAVYMVIEKLKIPDVKYIETDLLADDLLKENFVKINPQHTIPHLTDGNFNLWDSHAIITYLMNKYGKNYSYLYPTDPEKRALIDLKLHFDSGILYPALRENDSQFKMVLTVYKIDGSPPVRSVFMVIEALNIPDVEYVDVNLMEGEHLKEEYLKVNPQHTVPMLKDDDFYIWDSHAIATYLVTQYGENDSLYPADPKQRAIIDQRLHFDSGILFPALRSCVEPVFFLGEKSFRSENLAKIKKAYEFTEKFLSSPWLAGDEITLADICFVSTLSSMNVVMPVDENLFPNLSEWLERCSLQEFYMKGNESGLEQFRGLVQMKLA